MNIITAKKNSKAARICDKYIEVNIEEAIKDFYSNGEGATSYVGYTLDLNFSKPQKNLYLFNNDNYSTSIKHNLKSLMKITVLLIILMTIIGVFLPVIAAGNVGLGLYLIFRIYTTITLLTKMPKQLKIINNKIFETNLFKIPINYFEANKIVEKIDKNNSFFYFESGNREIKENSLIIILDNKNDNDEVISFFKNYSKNCNELDYLKWE